MEREAAAELDRKRREAWLATGPEVHYNSFPRSKSLVVVGVDLAVGFGAVKPTLHPSGLRARVELPLSDVITLFGTAGVQRSSFQQGAAARLDPAFSLGIGRTLQQEGSRVAFGGGAELVAFAHRVAPEQPSATLFPFVNLAASFCTFRYAVGQSKGCLAVGFEARLGVYIPFGGEEGGDGFRATSGGAARRVQGMGQFGLGPSFQF
jgi:hypothetical protein